MPVIPGFNSLPEWMKKRLSIHCPICGKLVHAYGAFPMHMSLAHSRYKPVSEEDNANIPHYAEVDDDRKLYLKYSNKARDTIFRSKTDTRSNLHFRLSFKEYVLLVYNSGLKSSQLGAKRGQYVLGRYCDTGDYTIDNCRFISVEENNREMLSHLYPSSDYDSGKESILVNSKKFSKEYDGINPKKRFRYEYQKKLPDVRIIYNSKRIAKNYDDMLYDTDITTHKKCSICGAKISRTSIHHDDICDECFKTMKSKIKPRKVKNRPSRDYLKWKLRYFPATAVGERYHASDVAVNSWCDWYKLPRGSKIRNMSEDEYNKL